MFSLASRVLDIEKDIHARYPCLVVETAVDGNKTVLIIRQKEMNSACSAGPVYNPRLLISDVGVDEPHFEFQVFCHVVFTGPYTPVAVHSYLQSMLPGSGYTVCPGIPNLAPEIRFKPKKYRQWKLPFVRHDSQGCKLWHVPTHHKRSPDDPLYDSCPSCKLLRHDLDTLVKRARRISASTRAKWQLPSSKRALKYFSPHSLRNRQKQSKLDRKAMMKSLKQYRKYDVTLHDDQNSELLKLVSSISDIGKDELEKVLKEADAKGKGRC